MIDYEKPYHILFNAVTDALEALGRLDVPIASSVLEDAQLQAEEIILKQE